MTPATQRRGAGLNERIVRALLALAALLLVAGAVYGVLASQTRQRTEQWDGPRLGFVQAGSCRRRYEVLPRFAPRPPDYLQVGTRTYVRGAGPVQLPADAKRTGYSHRGWRQLRAGGILYIQRTIGDGEVWRYTLGQCP